MVNSGLQEHQFGVGYELNLLADGSRNLAFRDLAALVDEAVAPLRLPADDPEPNRFDPDTFQGHLSLASHDCYERPDLVEEVLDYVRGLAVDYPRSFTGDVVTLYRTHSDDWTGRWWRTLTWAHVHTLAPVDAELASVRRRTASTPGARPAADRLGLHVEDGELPVLVGVQRG